MNIKVNPSQLKTPLKSYSQGILVPCGEVSMLFVTGQLPQNMEGEIMHHGQAEMQTRLVFENILKILKEVGMDYKDVVKIQIFVKDQADINVISSVRDELFAEVKPASTLVCVAGFAREGACVEIDAIASKSNSV